MKAATIVIAILLLFLILLSGCISQKVAEKEGAVTVTDSLGRNVTMPEKVNRIVSLAPGNTEILFALGLGDKVVGVTDYCDYPEEAKNKTKVGGFKTVNTEKVVSLSPDLVLATGGIQGSIVKEFEGLNITVIVLDPKNVSEVINGIRLVGNVTGKTKEAKNLTENMEKRMKNVTEQAGNTSKPRVFHVTWHDPLMSAGNGTMIGELIKLAGGVNIAENAKTKYPVYSLEVLVEQNPEIITVSSMGGGGPTVEGIREILKDKNITAVKNNRIYDIDSNLVDRPGPRIVDGLEDVAKIIHPEVFT
jgi:iron complex transport system substrate-binding protein